jgi:hypothetical protein
MRIVIVDKQRHRVGQDVDDGTDGLDTALRRARRIHDQAGAECAGDTATEAAERVDQPHRLGEAGRLSIECGLRTLRRAIPWAEAGAPRGDDEPVETVGETPKCRRD